MRNEVGVDKVEGRRWKLMFCQMPDALTGKPFVNNKGILIQWCLPPGIEGNLGSNPGRRILSGPTAPHWDLRLWRGNGCPDPVSCEIDGNASVSNHWLCGGCSCGRPLACPAKSVSLALNHLPIFNLLIITHSANSPLLIFGTLDMQSQCNNGQDGYTPR